jgi:ribonuclease E
VELATEVRYSGVVVGRGVPIRDYGAGGAFVVLAEPLPVGTRITLRGESGDEDARVTEVVESANPDLAGMRVSFGETAAKAAPAKAAPVVEAAPAKAAPVVEAAPAKAAPVVETAPEVHTAPESSAAVVEVPTSDSTASSAHPGDPQAGGPGKRKRRRR